MTYARWYPTLTKLPDGRMLAVSGAIDCPDCATPGAAHNGIAALPEIFDPATNTWSVLTGASLRLPIYPHMYVLPDGRIFAAATAEEAIASRVLDLNTQYVERRRQCGPRRRQLGDVPAGQDPEDG